MPKSTSRSKKISKRSPKKSTSRSKKISKRSSKKSTRKKNYKHISLSNAKKLVGKTVLFKGEQDYRPFKVKILGFVPDNYIEKNGERIYKTYSAKNKNLTIRKLSDNLEWQLFMLEGVYVDRGGWVKIK